MRLTTTTLSILAAMAFCGVACTGPIESMNLRAVGDDTPVPLCAAGAACDDSVSFTYLATGGFIIRSGREAIMTAPTFTHPGLWRVISGRRIRSDTAEVRASMNAVNMSSVRTLLVGHSHYDHLLDVPTIAALYPDLRIVGSPSMKHLLAGDRTLDPVRVIALGPEMVADATTKGTWHYVTDGNGVARFRVMPVRSSHAFNAVGITIAPWRQTTDRETLPGNAWTWRMGEVYAYLIDVIRPDSIPEFRVLYQDSASQPEYNVLPPLDRRDSVKVDVAIICAGNFEVPKDYPTTLLAKVQPKFVIVGHWEDFFRPQSEELRVIRYTNTNLLQKRMDERLPRERWNSLRPYRTLTFRYTRAPAPVK